MGSEIVTAIVEQRGQISTNPDDLSPNPSRPIEQIDATPSTQSPSEPVQQVVELQTAREGGNHFSRPVEQKQGAEFNPDGANPDDCFIEQKDSKRLTDENPDTPIEQLEFVTANLRDDNAPVSRLMEQKNLSRNVDTAQPIQQDPEATNSIDLTQFDFAELIFPACNSIKNPVTTNILWRIRDFGFPFDVETLIFRVNGVPVQDSSNFSVTPIVGGLQLDYDPPEPFDFGSTVTIILTISDNADPPNNFFYRCLWDTVEDTRPPTIELISPECDEENVDVKEPVVFSVFDAGVGVDQESIRLSIEGIPVCDGLTFDPQTVSSGSGFTVTWEHDNAPFRYESTVSVAIEASDLADPANSSFFVCCFETEESSIPEFINFDPEPCETFVDNTTGLSFEVYGNIDGVDVSTLEVRIDNKLRKVFVRPRVLRSE